MDANVIISIAAFAILTFLWLGFGASLLVDQEILSRTWRWFRTSSLLIQIIVTVLILPVVLGLWVWQTSWPGWLRLVLVAGLAWTTVYTFFPRLLFT